MDQAASPPLAPWSRRLIKPLIVVWAVCFFAFVVLVVIATMVFVWIKKTSDIRVRSSTDKFDLAVLDLKCEPDYLMQRIRVRCEGDMEAGIWVTDLKEAGIFEITDGNGATLYRDGRPDKTGSSAPVRANGKFSSCDILFSVRTTSSNTIWHHELAGGRLDSTLDRLAITGVQTNWPSRYPRGSRIPLANLGEYKIFISVK